MCKNMFFAIAVAVHCGKGDALILLIPASVEAHVFEVPCPCIPDAERAETWVSCNVCMGYFPNQVTVLSVPVLQRYSTANMSTESCVCSGVGTCSELAVSSL